MMVDTHISKNNKYKMSLKINLKKNREENRSLLNEVIQNTNP